MHMMTNNRRNNTTRDPIFFFQYHGHIIDAVAEKTTTQQALSPRGRQTSAAVIRNQRRPTTRHCSGQWLDYPAIPRQSRTVAQWQPQQLRNRRVQRYNQSPRRTSEPRKRDILCRHTSELVHANRTRSCMNYCNADFHSAGAIMMKRLRFI